MVKKSFRRYDILDDKKKYTKENGLNHAGRPVGSFFCLLFALVLLVVVFITPAHKEAGLELLNNGDYTMDGFIAALGLPIYERVGGMVLFYLKGTANYVILGVTGLSILLSLIGLLMSCLALKSRSHRVIFFAILFLVANLVFVSLAAAYLLGQLGI